jgi:hypothetical protein
MGPGGSPPGWHQVATTGLVCNMSAPISPSAYSRTCQRRGHPETTRQASACGLGQVIAILPVWLKTTRWVRRRCAAIRQYLPFMSPVQPPRMANKAEDPSEEGRLWSRTQRKACREWRLARRQTPTPLGGNHAFPFKHRATPPIGRLLRTIPTGAVRHSPDACIYGQSTPRPVPLHRPT